MPTGQRGRQDMCVRLEGKLHFPIGHRQDALGEQGIASGIYVRNRGVAANLSKDRSTEAHVAPVAVVDGIHSNSSGPARSLRKEIEALKAGY